MNVTRTFVFVGGGGCASRNFLLGGGWGDVSRNFRFWEMVVKRKFMPVRVRVGRGSVLFPIRQDDGQANRATWNNGPPGQLARSKTVAEARPREDENGEERNAPMAQNRIRPEKQGKRVRQRIG